MQFTCEIDGLDELQADWTEACGALADGVNRGVERGVEAGAAEAKSNHRYKDRSGRLTASVRGYLERGAVRAAGGVAVGVIEATAPYASFVEEGTRPHPIEAKHAEALHFEGSEGDVFRRRVQHPGTPSQPFIGPAVQKAERVIEVEVDLATERAAAIMSR